MPITEFDIIRRYFIREQDRRTDILMGIGDDAACIQIPEGQNLVCSQLLWTEGNHFPAGHDAFILAQTALTSACDKLQHCGAKPAWMTLSLQLPKADETWLEQFSRGLFTMAEPRDIRLVGGDTTRGNRTVCLHVCGYQTRQQTN